ncbi:MAG: 1,4-dihydroxy-6-naphthoate synthase [Micromonosporaceae bacterium]|nr:1,4-dihydroxy-6-naphthoate synthase [Micromonosporaceae bacterium]
MPEDHTFTDILYDVEGGVARITINRPDKLNAFTPHTVRELTVAFERAGDDARVGVVVLTGAGERAFCAGGDVSTENEESYLAGADSFDNLVKGLYRAIRDCLKPTIARINGYAIGGGHHLAYVCDLSIAAEHAILGQNGPRVASPAEGWIVSHLWTVIGMKRAKEMWLLCRRYSAAQALQWGLVNAVVPMEDLDAEVANWADELLALSPTVLKLLKKSFDDSWSWLREQQDRYSILNQVNPGFFESGEQAEGAAAFLEKRKPDFSGWR